MNEQNKQFSLVDDIIAALQNNDVPLSSATINEAIDKLIAVQKEAVKREESQRLQLEMEEERRKIEEEKAREEEHIRAVTSMELPLDWENAFAGDVRTQGIHAESIPDALILSLTNLAKVDIEYISSITGADYKTVICSLKGSIYQNPDTCNECFYKGWETADEYLSGNIIRKWRTARAANKCPLPEKIDRKKLAKTEWISGLLPDAHAAF